MYILCFQTHLLENKANSKISFICSNHAEFLIEYVKTRPRIFFFAKPHNFGVKLLMRIGRSVSIKTC